MRKTSATVGGQDNVPEKVQLDKDKAFYLFICLLYFLEGLAVWMVYKLNIGLFIYISAILALSAFVVIDEIRNDKS